MKLLLRLLISLALAVLLVAFLLWWGETRPSEILAAVAKLTPASFLLALAVQAAIYVLRALRFQALIAPARRPSFARILPISAAHSLAAYVLPAKTGEASFVVYMRATCGLPGAEGLAVLLVSRILDLATVAGSLSIACLVLSGSGVFPGLPWLLKLGLALALVTLVFLWLSARGHRLVALATRTAAALGGARTKLGARLIALASRVEEAMREVGGRRLVHGALLSLPVWLCVYLFYAILARGLGLADLDFAEAVFGSSLAVLANLLPVNGFAGFGTQDLGWVVGFTSLGASREAATESGLAFHFVYLANIVAFGLLGHLCMGLLRSPAPAQSGGPTEH